MAPFILPGDVVNSMAGCSLACKHIFGLICVDGSQVADSKRCALQAGVKFIIFSTLETMPPDVMADLPKLKDGPTVPHFQSKAMAQVYDILAYASQQ